MPTRNRVAWWAQCVQKLRGVVYNTVRQNWVRHSLGTSADWLVANCYFQTFTLDGVRSQEQNDTDGHGSFHALWGSPAGTVPTPQQDTKFFGFLKAQFVFIKSFLLLILERFSLEIKRTTKIQWVFKFISSSRIFSHLYRGTCNSGLTFCNTFYIVCHCWYSRQMWEASCLIITLPCIIRFFLTIFWLDPGPKIGNRLKLNTFKQMPAKIQFQNC